MLASEPVGGRSQPTELTCFPIGAFPFFPEKNLLIDLFKPYDDKLCFIFDLKLMVEPFM